MPFKKSGSFDVTSSAGLLISILACYPEIAAVNFDPSCRVLNFTFLSGRVFSPEELSKMKKKLRESIEVFHFLGRRRIRAEAVLCQEYEQLTIIEVQRDVDTLVSEEIALIVELLRECLGDSLITEPGGACLGEDLNLQEEVIAHLLDDVRGANEKSFLVAFRKKDRVLVFNK